MQCFRDQGHHVAACPKTSLRAIVDRVGSHGLTFFVGFEIEMVFLSWSIEDNVKKYGVFPLIQGHCWSSSRALDDGKLMGLVESTMTILGFSGIDIQQLHAKSAP